MTQQTLFVKMISKGIAGAIVGILSGLVLGLAIHGLQELVNYVASMTIASPDGKGTYNYFYSINTMIGFTTFGMCFGAMIGGVMGAIVGLREKGSK